MSVVIQLMELADGRIHKTYSFQFLRSFDPNGSNGRGTLEVTFKLDEAMKFENGGKALDFWRTKSDLTPFQPDGSYNRPLMTFNIQLIRA